MDTFFVFTMTASMVYGIKYFCLHYNIKLDMLYGHTNIMYNRNTILYH